MKNYEVKNAKLQGMGGRRRGGVTSARNPSLLRNQLEREKILNKKKGTLTKDGETRALRRSQTRERLKRNLESLASYCQPGVTPPDDVARDGWAAAVLRIFDSKKFGCWPRRVLLREIEHDVLVLALLERRKPLFPVWKAFEQVDKRMKKLRLKSHVYDLICRARAVLPQESLLNKRLREAIAGDAQARCLLRDLGQEPQKLVELLRDDRQMVIQRCMAMPLVEWLIDIMHPMAKDFHNIVELLSTVEEVKALRQRDKTRERVQLYRLKKSRRKSVTSA